MSFKTPAIFAAISVCAVLTFSACKNDKYANFKQVAGKSKSSDYSLKVPNHLYISTELNDEASLQYNDTAIEEYIIVIDEPKDEFISTFSADSVNMYDKKLSAEKNYRIVQMKSMSERMETKSGPTTTAAKINGLDAEIVDFTAKVEGIESDIYYKIAFIEGAKNMYMAMTWTLASDKDKNNDEMDLMLNSFSESK